jgi:signal recognition particle receptor subunit beta
VLPIELGEIAGVKTRIQMVAVPGGPDQAPTRKQLLDRVDGIVLVLDARRERIAENVEAYQELRRALADYGRALADVPLVVQYNKRDLADPYALEELHRRLDLRGVPVFEAVATEATGVLQTLSTISKRVIRVLREPEARRARAAGPAPGVAAAAAAEAPTVVEFAPPTPPPEPAVAAAAQVPGAPGQGLLDPEPDTAGREPTPAERMERALLEEDAHPEAAALADAARGADPGLAIAFEEIPGEIERGRGVRLGPDVSIVSVGEASRADARSVRVPIVLGDADGGTSTLVLTVRLDPVVEAGTDPLAGGDGG